MCGDRTSVRSLSVFKGKSARKLINSNLYLDSKMSTRNILAVIHGIAHKHTQDQILNNMRSSKNKKGKVTRVSSKTVSDLITHISKKIVEYMKSIITSFTKVLIYCTVHFQPLGGEGEIVETDESQFGTKQKDHKGRETKNSQKMVLLIKHRRSGIWLGIHLKKDKRDNIAIGQELPKYLYYNID